MEIRILFELHGRTWYFNPLHSELMDLGHPDCSCPESQGDGLAKTICDSQYTMSFHGTLKGLETENVTIWPNDSEEDKREFGLEGVDTTMIVRRLGECYDKGVADAKKLIESPEYAVVLPWVNDYDDDELPDDIEEVDC